MKLTELQTKIDEYVGLSSILFKERDNATLTYLVADTGVVLFEIGLCQDRDGGWRFGNTSGALPGQWTKLCRMHREE